MSSPRMTAQQRPKASKANYESSQGDDQGDGQADPFRPWHHANKPGLKHASRRQNSSWPAHVRKIPVTKKWAQRLRTWRFKHPPEVAPLDSGRRKMDDALAQPA